MFSLLLTAFASVILWEFSLLSPLVICECLGGWDIGMVSPIHTSVLMFFFIPTNSIHRGTKGARSIGNHPLVSLQTLSDKGSSVPFIPVVGYAWLDIMTARLQIDHTSKGYEVRPSEDGDIELYNGHGQSGARQMSSLRSPGQEVTYLIFS